MTIIMRQGFVVGTQSFTTGLVRRKCTVPTPLSEDDVLTWACEFENHGHASAALELITRYCQGETIYRQL